MITVPYSLPTLGEVLLVSACVVVLVLALFALAEHIGSFWRDITDPEDLESEEEPTEPSARV